MATPIKVLFGFHAVGVRLKTSPASVITARSSRALATSRRGVSGSSAVLLETEPLTSAPSSRIFGPGGPLEPPLRRGVGRLLCC